jgi:hypothetical protein
MVLNFTDGYDVFCWLSRKLNTKYFKEVSHSVTVFCNQLPTFYERILYTIQCGLLLLPYGSVCLNKGP